MSTWFYGNHTSSPATWWKACNRLLVWLRQDMKGWAFKSRPLTSPHWRPSCSSFINTSTVQSGSKASTSLLPSLDHVVLHRDWCNKPQLRRKGTVLECTGALKWTERRKKCDEGRTYKDKRKMKQLQILFFCFSYIFFLSIRDLFTLSHCLILMGEKGQMLSHKRALWRWQRGEPSRAVNKLITCRYHADTNP